MNQNTFGSSRAYRKGISVPELFLMFPDDKVAEKWFEEQRWPSEERSCPDCGSTNTTTSTHRDMPYRCRDCMGFLSVRKGTVMQSSKIGLQKWAIALYLATTNPKGVSALKLHRDLGMTHKTAWNLMHRIREGFGDNTRVRFSGPVEIDEPYFGSKEKNKKPRKKPRSGRGTVGKKAVASIRDRDTNQIRAQVVPNSKADSLKPRVRKNVEPAAMKYTDEMESF